MNRRLHFTYSQCGGPRWSPANLAASAWVGRLCFADAENGRRARAASALGCKALNEIEKHGPADARKRPVLPGRALPRRGSSPGPRTPTSPYVALHTAKIHTLITLGIRVRTNPHVFKARNRLPRGFDSHRPLHYSAPLSIRKLQCLLDRLKSRLLAQGIHERIGLEERQARIP
jgi:hypothetical protein